MEGALRQRRAELHLVVENVADPHNAQTVCRTAEAIGVQHVHVIESVCQFQLPSAAAHATARGALGRSDDGEAAGRWLSIHKHASAEDCLADLERRGVKVFVSDCPTINDDDAADDADDAIGDSADGAAAATPTLQQRLAARRAAAAAGTASSSSSSSSSSSGRAARVDTIPSRDGEAATHEGMGFVVRSDRSSGAAVPIAELDFGACVGDGGGSGAALVFGNERRGVSSVMLDHADGAFYLPMSGFTQSFNVGVALGMSLGAAVASGHFPPGTLHEDEQAELLGRWLLRDIKAARGLLAQAGLEFEDF